MLIKQFNCIEGKNIDLRQADAVLKYKPDIIIWEAPNNSNSPDSLFNRYSPSHKPLSELRKIKSNLKKVSKKYPWVRSDIKVYENIEKLWKSGHNVKIYYVDGPAELLQQTLINKWNVINGPHRRGTHLLWWIYVYLREQVMASYISKILSENQKKDATALMFLQKFHWRNIQFRIGNPGKDKIWKYYFGKFRNLTPKKVERMLKEDNLVLYRYWKKA